MGTLFHLFSVDADSFNIFTFCSVTGVILWLFAIAGVVPTRPKRVISVEHLFEIACGPSKHISPSLAAL